MRNRRIPNLTLRQRVSATLIGFGIAVCLLVQTAAHIVNEKIEHSAWKAALQATASMLESAANTDETLTDSDGKVRGNDVRLRYWAACRTRFTPIPEPIAKLQPGFHEGVRFGHQNLVAFVDGEGPSRFVIGYESSEVEHKEILLIGAEAIGIALLFVLLVKTGLVVGAWLTEPVHDLAERVRNIDPNAPISLLAPTVQHSELAMIAEAIDRLIERLQAVARREKEFTGMASHELRTPMAVIAGALDVLETVADVPAAAQRPIDRIRRSTGTMTQMTGALLFLARQEASGATTDAACDVQALLPEIVESHTYLLRGNELSLEIGLTAPLEVIAPRAALLIGIGNLVRNAIEHSNGTRVTLSIEGNRAIVRDNGEGMTEGTVRSGLGDSLAQLPGRSSGIGLSIVRRLCDRFQWTLTFQSSSNGTVASISFPEPAAYQLEANEDEANS